MSGIIALGANRKQLECVCLNKVFSLVVNTNIKDGSAEVIEVWCASCGKGVTLNGGRIGVNKPLPETDEYTDRRGRRHHLLKADVGWLGEIN